MQPHYPYITLKPHTLFTSEPCLLSRRFVISITLRLSVVFYKYRCCKKLDNLQSLLTNRSSY